MTPVVNDLFSMITGLPSNVRIPTSHLRTSFNPFCLHPITMAPHQHPNQPIESTPLIAGSRKATRKRASTTRFGLHQLRPRAHPFQSLDKALPWTYSYDSLRAQQSESRPLLPHFSTGTPLLYTDTHGSRGGWENSTQLDAQKPAPGSSHTTSSRRSRFPPNLLRHISLRLENSGSVARDHLASERTFLAYMRTSLAISASGVGEQSGVCPWR